MRQGRLAESRGALVTPIGRVPSLPASPSGSKLATSQSVSAAKASIAVVPKITRTSSISLVKTDLWFSANLRLEEINPVQQHFVVNGWLNFFWMDPTLPQRQSVEKGFSIVDDGMNQPINPNAMFENAVECEVFGEPIFRYRDGLVSETIQFKATLAEELELARFPFDRQYLTSRICIRTKNFFCLSSPPDYVLDQYNWRSLASYTCSPSVAGWHALSPVVGYCRALGQSDDMRITVSLRVEREHSYWLTNIAFPIFLIVSLAPITFFISPDDIGERMGIILALLLTLVTFKFVIASDVPKTSVLTLLDKYILIGYLMLICVVIQTLVILQLKPSRWHTYNMYSALLTESFWVCFHIWILEGAYHKSFSVPWDQMKDEDAHGSSAEKNGRAKALLVAPRDTSLPTAL